MATVADTLSQLEQAERALRQRLDRAENRQITQALAYAVGEVTKARQVLGMAGTSRASVKDQAQAFATCNRHLNQAAGAVNQAIGTSRELTQLLSLNDQVNSLAREAGAALQTRPQPAQELPPTADSRSTAQAIADQLEPMLTRFQKAAPSILPAQRERANTLYQELNRLSIQLRGLANGQLENWTPNDIARLWTRATETLGALAVLARDNGLDVHTPGLDLLADKARDGLTQLKEEARAQDTAPTTPTETPAATDTTPTPVGASSTDPARQVRMTPNATSTASQGTPNPGAALADIMERLARALAGDAAELQSRYGLTPDQASKLAKQLPSVMNDFTRATSGLRVLRSMSPLQAESTWDIAVTALAKLDPDVIERVPLLTEVSSFVARRGTPAKLALQGRVRSRQGLEAQGSSVHELT